MQVIANDPASARDLRGTLAPVALAFLVGAHTEAGGDLAAALAMAVLRVAAEVPGEWTHLALDVRDGDPSWPAKAVALAGLVVPEVVGRETLAAPALAFLRGADTDAGGDLATALAMAVLRVAAEVPGAWTHLALAVRDGDPSWPARAVTLAGLVVGAEPRIADADERKAGTR